MGECSDVRIAKIISASHGLIIVHVSGAMVVQMCIVGKKRQMTLGTAIVAVSVSLRPPRTDTTAGCTVFRNSGVSQGD